MQFTEILRVVQFSLKQSITWIGNDPDGTVPENSYLAWGTTLVRVSDQTSTLATPAPLTAMNLPLPDVWHRKN